MAKKYTPNKATNSYKSLRMFADADAARRHIEKVLWAGKPACPFCENTDKITTRKRPGFYRCNPCKRDFTVRTNTILEKSKIPLDKWIMAIYLVATSRKGISSLQLSKELGITQKSAWFMSHHIREACQGNKAGLSGIVEVDETYIGGKEKRDPADKKPHSGRGGVGKKALYEISHKTKHKATTSI